MILNILFAQNIVLLNIKQELTVVFSPTHEPIFENLGKMNKTF